MEHYFDRELARMVDAGQAPAPLAGSILERLLADARRYFTESCRRRGWDDREARDRAWSYILAAYWADGRPDSQL